MTWECSHLVWISLLLVAIGWYWVPSVAILSAGVRVVVAPWHGHHAQHIPPSEEDCFIVAGALMNAGGIVLYPLFPFIRDDLSHIAIPWNNRLRAQILIRHWRRQSEYWKLLNSSHRLRYCDLFLWPGYNMIWDTISHPIYPPTSICCFALRHILDITGWPLCNDSIYYSHKLGGISNLSRYAMQESSMLRSCLRPNTLRARISSCSTMGTFEANPWINNWFVASYVCLAHIINVCIGFIHGVNSCIEKSRPFSCILYEGWLCWQHLQVQPLCLECTWFQNCMVVL